MLLYSIQYNTLYYMCAKVHHMYAMVDYTYTMVCQLVAPLPLADLAILNMI